jgi:hypothetical protein
MYEKRVYLTKVVFVDKVIAGEVIPTQVPYLASLPIDPTGPDDPYEWDVIYDDKGDEDGVTPGHHDKCMVGVYTTLENHALLEADPDILRIDNL